MKLSLLDRSGMRADIVKDSLIELIVKQSLLLFNFSNLKFSTGTVWLKWLHSLATHGQIFLFKDQVFNW